MNLYCDIINRLVILLKAKEGHIKGLQGRIKELMDDNSNNADNGVNDAHAKKSNGGTTRAIMRR